MEQTRINKANSKELQPFSITKYIEHHGTMITLLIAIAGILGPVGYVIGVIYHQVYLSTFGINAGLFPISAQDSYLYAYLVGTAYINKALYYLFSMKALYIATALLSGLVIFGYCVIKIARWFTVTDEHETKNRSFLNSLLSKLHPENNDLSKVLVVIFELFNWMGRASYTILILALCWLFPLLGAYSQAESSAQTSLDAYLKEGCIFSTKSKHHSCTKILSADGKVIAEGYIVIATGNKIAFINKEGTHIRDIQPTETLLKTRQ